MAGAAKSIMVVEDEPIVALDLESTLERLGYVVVARTDRGEDVERLAADTHPDLILMDINLAGEMDGVEAGGRAWRTYRIPVIYLTAYSTTQIVERAAGTEPFGYLIKPFRTNELRTSIEVALRKGETEHALRDAHDELERRVSERTAELRTTNESLRREISERLLVEAQLREAKDVAEHASRAKSEFLATVSHELRTPLNAIIGYGEILLEEAQEHGQATQAEYLQRIRESSGHLLCLVNDVLDLSRIEAGSLQIDTEPVPLVEFVRGIRPAAEKLMAANENEFHVGLSDGLGTILADPQRLRQCLLNLLSNAAKFTHHGRVDLRVARTEDAGRSWVDIGIRDTGLGISQDHLDGLFDAFTQVDSSATRRFGGLGLGLAITARLCRMMGGAVRVVSEPGEGSTFTLRLPG